ncbi:hypothetical protein KP509_29G065500 [Ceratopteris richardii]|nr:hypothetical protein KP509_29G065500 [Ceratopteris richardii]
MCSHGGKILPRPSDRRLRYVGGETRMVSVPRYISFEALLQKLTDNYGHDLTVKYQLPEEDLDALVSVTSDEDLENMMDECDRLESLEGASRLRVFVFSSRDAVALDLSDITDPTASEIRYVDAVNEASFKRSNDSNTSFGQLDYGWNTPQMRYEDSYPSNASAPLYFTKPEDMPSVVAPPSQITHRQHTAPLEFISIQGTDKGGYGVAGDDFRDLESGGSASSSTSSQHDLHNRHHWASRSHKQSHMEVSAFGPQFQDFMTKGSMENSSKHIEQMHFKNGNQRGGHNIHENPLERFPDELNPVPILDAISDTQETGSNLHSGVPLSPGTMLKRQLGADQNLHITNGTGMDPTQINEKLVEPSVSLSIPTVNKSVDSGQQMHNLLHTQPFEPHSNQPFLDSASEPAQPSILTRQPDESRKTELSLQELMKWETLSMDQSRDFQGTEYPNVLFNEAEKERNDISVFASQSFSKEPYATVFQTCSSEIPLTSMDEADDLLQVLSPTMNFTGQMSMGEYHKGITSQGPWTSPDLGSFTMFQGGMPISESANTNVDHITAQNIGFPRTQNYEPVRGVNGLQMQGDEKARNLMDVVPTQPELTSNVTVHIDKQSIGSPTTQNYEDTRGIGRLHVQVDKVGDTPVCHTGQSEEFLAPSKVPSKFSGPLQDDCLADLSEIGKKQETSLGSSGDVTDKQSNSGISHTSPGLTELSLDDSWHMLSNLQQTGSLGDPSIQKSPVSEADESFTQMEEEMGSFTLQSPSAAPVGEPLLEVWRTTAQSEHETQSEMLQVFNKEEDTEEGEHFLDTMEKEMTIDDPKSDIEEFDTFQSAADNRSMNPAAAAEAEAIARGLQIIRYCDLEELKELGSGTFGTVYHGKWRGTDVAIKRIKSSCFTGRPAERERLIADFWREAYILGQLHHPNVVAFYGVVPDVPGGALATVTEYMVNGSLKQALQKKDRSLDRRKRLLIAMDAAFGMEYLHGKNVVHFDIKCENLLVNLRDLQRPICKVGDLGLSKVKQQTMVSGGVRGTLPWMAPELLNGSSSLVSEKVDVFSFGIVLWELLTGEEPYASLHYGAIIGGIVSNTLRPPVPQSCDPAYRSLMETCWSADPSERPSFSEIARRLRAMEMALSTKVHAQPHALIKEQPSVMKTDLNERA